MIKRLLTFSLICFCVWMWFEPTRRSGSQVGIISEVLGRWHENRHGAFPARVIGVSDGDTVTVLTPYREKVTVRLEGIDAPEKGQHYGDQSRKMLRDMIAGQDVLIVPKEQDQYGRTVGRIYFGEQDINKQMISLGVAWHFTRYSREVSLMTAQFTAKSEKRGLWATGDAVEPWEWRKQRR